jgi:hypothetical protein
MVLFRWKLRIDPKAKLDVKEDIAYPPVVIVRRGRESCRAERRKSFDAKEDKPL